MHFVSKACDDTYVPTFVQVDSLSKALSFSQHENLALKAQIAKVRITVCVREPVKASTVSFSISNLLYICIIL